jgi:hypothetical protein
VPPRDPAYPPPGQGFAQDRGTGWHAAGPGAAPGYAAPGGPRPAAPGHAGGPRHRGPADADASFDGGYARVIRASDHPVRPPDRARPPAFGRPAEPPKRAEGSGPADVYVYRDTSDQAGAPAAAGQGPGENDTAYWYDLPGSGAGTDAPPQRGEETRGPFEPLVSSSDPPGAARSSSEAPDAAEPVGQAPANDGPGGTHGETAYDRARKLEQIKDLYLTAEAIGEANVDKHFDQLLAQQRELISEYFMPPGGAGPAAGAPPAEAPPAGAPPAGAAGPADQAETRPGARRDPGPLPGGPATPPEGARVAADHPRAW